MQDYSFITIWKLNAPLEKVWNEILNAEQWPEWWKGVVKVETVEAGESNGMNSVRIFTFKSALPYKLSFHSRVTAVEYLQRIEGLAFGELDGQGIWTLTTTGETTVVRYDWMVKTTRWWMNILAPIARPAFEWNHDVIMKWGGKGLANRLGCELLP
ncbi:MAG: SRPBCC family protein [Flavobacteriales bacterium]